MEGGVVAKAYESETSRSKDLIKSPIMTELTDQQKQHARKQANNRLLRFAACLRTSEKFSALRPITGRCRTVGSRRRPPQVKTARIHVTVAASGSPSAKDANNPIRLRASTSKPLSSKAAPAKTSQGGLPSLRRQANLTKSPPRAGIRRFSESPHQEAIRQRLNAMWMPVAKRKSLSRAEVNRGERAAMTKAGRRKAISASRIFLEKVAKSMNEKIQNSAIASPPKRSKIPPGNLFLDFLGEAFRKSRSFCGRRSEDPPPTLVRGKSGPLKIAKMRRRRELPRSRSSRQLPPRSPRR